MKQKKDVNKIFKVAQFKFDGHLGIIVYEERLREAVPLIKKGLLESSRLLHTENDVIIDVSSTNDEFIKNRMGGIGGLCPNSYTLSLRINNTSTQWKRFVVGTIAHEFSHMIRFQRISKKKYTLSDYLTLEGLAQCFEEQLTGLVRPWSKAITHKQATTIWAKLRKRLNVESRDLYQRLFLEQKDKEFPHWSGYTIGYLIIKDNITRLGEDWNTIISMETEALIGSGFSDV